MIRHSVMVGWADGPLKRYVDDARLQFTVLMHRSGQVLAQHGFQSRMDVQTACALSAAINAFRGSQLGFGSGKDQLSTSANT